MSVVGSILQLSAVLLSSLCYMICLLLLVFTSVTIIVYLAYLQQIMMIGGGGGGGEGKEVVDFGEQNDNAHLMARIELETCTLLLCIFVMDDTKRTSMCNPILKQFKSLTPWSIGPCNNGKEQ